MPPVQVPSASISNSWVAGGMAARISAISERTGSGPVPLTLTVRVNKPAKSGLDKTWGSCGAFADRDCQATVEDSGPYDGNAVSSLRRPPHPAALSHAGIGNVID